MVQDAMQGLPSTLQPAYIAGIIWVQVRGYTSAAVSACVRKLHACILGISCVTVHLFAELVLCYEEKCVTLMCWYAQHACVSYTFEVHGASTWQGEKNSNKNGAHPYAARFTQWVAAARSDLAPWAGPTPLPVAMAVMAVTGRKSYFPYIDVVRAQQLNLTLPGLVKGDMEVSAWNALQ